jgi:uncharacterized membrane protein
MHKLSSWSARLGRFAFWSAMAVGVGLMLSASASYLELGEQHPFVLEKLPLAHPRLWRGALYAHVPSALFALPACLVLLSARVRRRAPRLHRWLGRLTGGLILCVVVPSGMYLALFAQGGYVTTLGFWLTGAIAFGAMFKSIAAARAGDMQAHRRFSTHVVAQLAVAVLSRFLLAGAELAGFYDEWVYVAALWAPVIGCALVAELLTQPRSALNSKGTHHEALAVRPRLDVVR